MTGIVALAVALPGAGGNHFIYSDPGPGVSLWAGDYWSQRPARLLRFGSADANRRAGRSPAGHSASEYQTPAPEPNPLRQ